MKNEVSLAVYVDLIHEAMENRQTSLERLVAGKGSTLRKNRIAAMEQLVQIDGCLVFEQGKWWVHVWSDEDNQPLCPVCGAILYGQVEDAFYKCPLSVRDGEVEASDGRLEETDLVAIYCDHCSLVLEEHHIEFRGVAR